MAGTHRGIVGALWAVLIAIPVLLAALYFINPFGARSLDPRLRIVGHAPYRVPSSSMRPTVQPGQIVIARTIGPEAPLRRGDVVTLRVPEHDGLWLQRIVGLPGETLAIQDGSVLIDGRPLAEPYVQPDNASSDYSQTLAAVRIPAGRYFMLGDNRDNSMDSRLMALARRENITGRIVAHMP